MSQEENSMLGFMEDIMAGNTSDDFYYYEPFDSMPEGRQYNSNGFQVAYHASDCLMRFTTAANRMGKSQQMGVEAVIMMTGEVPYAMRYPAGVKTPFVRPWEGDVTNPEGIGMLNRMRHGFKDPVTGEWIPPLRQPDLPDPGWTADAPCGYIEGVGVYPAKKISKNRSDKVWICTYKVTRDERWVPFMKNLIPKQFLDTRYSPDGYSKKDEKFRLTNGNEITFITYEQGPERAQGAGIFAVFLDEEPKDRKFWTEVTLRLTRAGFSGYQSISFTPLLGLSWSYTDLFKPASEGKLKNIEIFHATQYDSPYLSIESIESTREKLKGWEIEARIYGRYSEMAGRPYYDYEKLIGSEGSQGWVDLFIPRKQLFFVRPQAHCQHLTDLLGTEVTTQMATPADCEHDGWWEFYEDLQTSASYYITCDTAKGHENVEDAQDRNVAYVFRLPGNSEPSEWPVKVAAMRTSLPTLSFAREVWYAAMYWNYAMIAPESKGETGATLMTEIRDWPFFYHMVTINDKTHKPQKHYGFETNAKTRQPVFDFVGDYINSFNSPSCMKHHYLLKECAALIYGKNGRPDHPPKGTSDCVVAFGIGLYVYRNARSQITCNARFGQERAVQYKKRLTEENNQAFANYRKKDVLSGMQRPLGAKPSGNNGRQLNRLPF